MATSYILKWRNDAKTVSRIWLVGPFPTEREGSAWGRKNADDIRWQLVTLKHAGPLVLEVIAPTDPKA